MHAQRIAWSQACTPAVAPADSVRRPIVLTVQVRTAAENSYSHHSDPEIGVSVIDRLTYYTQRFFEGVSLMSTATLQDWYRELTFDRVHSTIVPRYAPASSVVRRW